MTRILGTSPLTRLTAVLALSSLAALTLPAATFAASAPTPTVRQATGKTADDVKAAVEQFRADLGGGNTAGPNGSFGGARREINWDAVPDQFASPNDLPLDFFNTRSPRGVVFSTPGASVLVSARASSSVPVRFGDLNATYANEFGAFSPERIFGAGGSTVTEVSFFVPGTQTKAVVKGFGVVFTDVDSADSSGIEFYGLSGESIYVAKAPATPGLATFSFVGATFPEAVVTKVKVTSGGAVLSSGVNDGPVASRDKVAMDDFLYSEPVAVSAAPTTVVDEAPATTVPATPTTAAPTTAATTAAPATTARAKTTTTKKAKAKKATTTKPAVPATTQPATTKATATTKPAATTAPATTAKPVATTTPAAAGGVTISDFTFRVAATVKAGPLEVRNADAVGHTFTADDLSVDSGIVRAGQSATVTLTAKGVFKFHCEIHPSMKGTVTVT